MFSKDKIGLIKCLMDTMDPLDHLLWRRGMSEKQTEIFFSTAEEILALFTLAVKERPEAGIRLFLVGALA